MAKRSATKRDDVIEKLTPQQALAILKRLSENEGEIRDAVHTEARTLLQAVNLDETADEAFFVLDSIDVQDCWDRSGSSRYGYTEPSEAAVELVEEELQPFYDQAARYHELDMPEQEMTYCMGVILGIYRYEHESSHNFGNGPRIFQLNAPATCSPSDGNETLKQSISRRWTSLSANIVRSGPRI
jgi:hypothetical protein